MTGTALWRRLDRPGHDTCRFHRDGSCGTLLGAAVWGEAGHAAALVYRVVCDGHWRCVEARVTGWIGTRGVSLKVARDRAGRWSVDGAARPDFDGLADIDLGFTPATNTCALRRLALGVGRSGESVAVWLDEADWQVGTLRQTYRRLDAARYLYRAPAQDFEAILDVDPQGVVVLYPGLFERMPGRCRAGRVKPLRASSPVAARRGAMISLQFLLTAFVVVIVPGTGVVYTLAMGLGRGRAAALAAAAGCTFGIVPALAAAMVGLAAVLHTSALLFAVVKFAGVAYLLWMAWGALRQTGAVAVRAERGRGSLPRVALRGTLINVLNPKLSIFFLALLPPFLSGDPARASVEMASLGAVFMAMTFAVFALYGLFAGAFRDRLLSSERAMAWLNRSFAAIFAALAGRLAVERA